MNTGDDGPSKGLLVDFTLEIRVASSVVGKFVPLTPMRHLRSFYWLGVIWKAWKFHWRVAQTQVPFPSSEARHLAPHTERLSHGNQTRVLSGVALQVRHGGHYRP